MMQDAALAPYPHFSGILVGVRKRLIYRLFPATGRIALFVLRLVSTRFPSGQEKTAGAIVPASSSNNTQFFRLQRYTPASGNIRGVPFVPT